MKTHTNNFKNAIKQFGRQLDSKITYEIDEEEIELGNDNLNSVTPVFKGTILKSAMKELDIDSNTDIPLGTVVNYQFGVKVGNAYEYLDFGNYIVYSSEKQEDLNSYKIVCYDNMLKSMVEYTELQNGEFPMTVREYITNLCEDLGLEFANESQVFANYDKTIETDLYANLGYTYRDIFDELSQVTASTICIDKNDKLEVRYITNTNDTINEEYLKDINVNFGKKFGAVNTIVLSRAADSDRIYYPDPLPANPVEIKISENQIMNGNDRSTYMPDIYAKLNGLEYYINDYTSTGIAYYDLCDRYNVQIGDTFYSCVMFNNEVDITQGLEEIIYTDTPEESVTDYTKADKVDRKINGAYIIVDKQNARIDLNASSIDTINNTLNEVSGTVDSQGARLNVVSTNIDENGNVTSVKTTEGFTFDNNGLNISNTESQFNTQITNTSTQYKNGDEIITETSKDGFMTTDLKEKGEHYYSWDGYAYEFVAERMDSGTEVAYAHFYIGED